MPSSSSTEDEENTPECLNKSKNKHCFMHITSVKHEEVHYFTTTRWNTFRTSLQTWLGLEGESRDMAENFKHCVDVEFENIPEDAGFHHTCYRRFTDKNPSQRWKDVSHMRDKKRRKTTRPFHRLLGARVQQRNCDPGQGCQSQALAPFFLPCA